MASVFANSRSIVHKGDGLTNVAPAPDVCKTPSPGGPVPIPYPNAAQNSDLASGSKKTKIEGNSIGHADANLSTSTGDEAGTAGGGVVSSKFKGKLTWTSSSTDVKVEGKGVVRFGEPTMHNGNTGNVPGIEMGNPMPSYGSDFTGKCAICDKSHDTHPNVKDSPKRPTAKHITELIDRLTKDHTTDKLGQMKTAKEVAGLHIAQCKGIEAKKKKVEAYRRYYEVKTRPDAEADQEVALATRIIGKLVQAKRIADGRRKAANAEAARLEAESRTSPVATSSKPFYMVGTMMCESHTSADNATVYVAHSGSENLDGFKRVASGMPGTFVPVPVSGAVGPADYARKNSMLSDPAKMATFTARWEQVSRDSKLKDNAMPDPGICAAQHLLAHESHQPRAMTEAWFDPGGKDSVRVRHIRDARGFYEALQKELEVDWTAVESKEYGHQSFVPSCRSCQALLAYMLCDEKPNC